VIFEGWLAFSSLLGFKTCIQSRGTIIVSRRVEWFGKGEKNQTNENSQKEVRSRKGGESQGSLREKIWFLIFFIPTVMFAIFKTLCVFAFCPLHNAINHLISHCAGLMIPFPTFAVLFDRMSQSTNDMNSVWNELYSS
jgi:hypothetical protein